MDGARDQLLAGPALSRDQNGGPAGRRLDDEVEDLLHPGAASDDAGELLVLRLEVLAESRVLSHQLATLDGIPDDDQHLVVLEGLCDVVECATLHGGN